MLVEGTESHALHCGTCSLITLRAFRNLGKHAAKNLSSIYNPILLVNQLRLFNESHRKIQLELVYVCKGHLGTKISADNHGFR